MAAPPIPPDLHELESEVMEQVWRAGEVSVRDVMDALNADGARSRAYTTYMTILSRLHDKGLLERRRDGRTDHYRATFSREEYAHARSNAEIEALVDRYGDVALSHFAAQVAELDPRRRRALERLARER